MKALALAARERLRQITEEGWSPDHDDTHVDGELAAAGAAYAASAEDQARGGKSALDGMPPAFWPWDDAWWKPADPRRNLVKAIALLVAEHERLERLERRDNAAPPAPETCCSRNDERFEAMPLEEFVADHEIRDGEIVFIGDRHNVTADTYTTGAAEVVAEHIEIQAQDHAGELAEAWDVEGDDALQALIEAWAQTLAPPGYFIAENVAEYRVRIGAGGIALEEVSDADTE